MRRVRSTCTPHSSLAPKIQDLDYNGKLAFISLFFTIAYIFMGGFLFFYLEDCREHTIQLGDVKTTVTNFCVNWTNDPNKTFHDQAHLTKAYQAIDTVHYYHDHHSECEITKKSISTWVEFAVVTIHTIGFGNTVPRTSAGKITVIFYSMIGIPLTIMQYTYVSQAILSMIKCAIFMFEIQILRRKSIRFLKTKILVCAIVMFLFVLMLGAAITSHNDLDNYSWFESIYFWWISMSTIGYGDKGFQWDNYMKHHPTYIVFVFLFLIVGIAMIATTLSAIMNFTNKKAQNRFSKRYKGKNRPVENNSNDVIQHGSCCRCYSRRLDDEMISENILTSVPEFNQSSCPSSTNSSSMELRKKTTKVIENNNRADSQKSMKLLSDLEYSEDDVFRQNSSEDEELKNISPKMVTSTVATTRSSNLTNNQQLR